MLFDTCLFWSAVATCVCMPCPRPPWSPHHNTYHNYPKLVGLVGLVGSKYGPMVHASMYEGGSCSVHVWYEYICMVIVLAVCQGNPPPVHIEGDADHSTLLLLKLVPVAFHLRMNKKCACLPVATKTASSKALRIGSSSSNSVVAMLSEILWDLLNRSTLDCETSRSDCETWIVKLAARIVKLVLWNLKSDSETWN